MSGVRRVALVLAGVALAGLVALIALGWLASRQSDRLVAGIGWGLGREVAVEELGFTLRGGVGARLAGVRIAEDPAVGGTAPFLTARGFELRLRVLPLLRRALVVDRVLVDQPVVNLVREANGRLNVDSLGRRSGAAPPASPEAPPAAPTPPKSTGGPAATPPAAARPAFQIALLELRDGTVRYLERGSGRAMELTDVAVEAHQPGLDAPLPVTVRARIATAQLRLDGIESEGELDPAPARPSYRGRLRAGPGALGTLPLDRLEAAVHASPPTVELESFTLALLGGTVTGTGRLVSEGQGAGLTARVTAQGLELAQLPAPENRPRPAGRLEVHGTLAAPPPGGRGFKGGMAGEGRFAVADGRLAGVVLGGGILDAVGPFLKPGAADRLRTRYPDLFAADELRFTRLSGSGRLAGGRIRSDDLVLAGASYEARGEGTLTLEGEVDVVVRVTGSPALTDDLLGDSRARPALVDANGRVTIPLRVRGPLRRPHVTPDASFVSTAARGLLGGRDLEGLGDALNRFLGGRKRKR